MILNVEFVLFQLRNKRLTIETVQCLKLLAYKLACSFYFTAGLKMYKHSIALA